MKKTFLPIITCFFIAASLMAQNKPCSDPVYRQFDFWVGEWDAFAPNGKKAGDSKISVMLDSCIVLEEWTSVQPGAGLRYVGKSFNTYNANTKQWQQTWVDNSAASIEFLMGKFSGSTMQFKTNPFAFSKDTMAIRQLTFFNLEKNKVRQLGEISKDNGSTWVTEYDFEYRRKAIEKSSNIEIVKQLFAAFNEHDWKKMTSLYTDPAIFLDPAYGNGYVQKKQDDLYKHHTELQAWSPDVKDSVTFISAVADNKVLVQFISSGIMAKEKVKWSLPVCDVFTIENGKIVKDETYYDKGQAAAY